MFTLSFNLTTFNILSPLIKIQNLLHHSIICNLFQTSITASFFFFLFFFRFPSSSSFRLIFELL
ncbi:hypothetical protein HanRHA438_Chr08g0331201 [Helianthus annuus]|nr:hypothetical protein HanRHA438_Chr08g0331201 [Helianthus annuus]